MMMNVHIVMGTRPQYIKLAALRGQLAKSFDLTVIDTGQHYDHELSGAFLSDLGLQMPDVNLHIGSGKHGAVTGNIMIGLEKIWAKEAPQLVLVVGDTDSCLGGALAAAKLGIPVAHVEAGLRSFEKRLPEEINRVLTDHLADILFTTEPIAEKNLIREGIAPSTIHYVGNVMIDCLLRNLEVARGKKIWEQYSLVPKKYVVVTLHRPDNVDSIGILDGILESISMGAGDIPLVFPAHLRTRKNLNKITIPQGIRLVPPLGYLDFISLMSNSRFVVTDSGGVQEESSVLGIPCVTLRETTERPITVDKGTNILGGTKRHTIISAIEKAKEHIMRPKKIPRWDGKAAERLVSVLRKWEKEKTTHG